ncbi:hypothetical protein LUZ63_009284 [Rhynchospora breviuscula]|uniref:non-specific serine/threonine protein kinase n=1 Tax=Rhynchospora breviuscula TaxID=2022672 RepID=A0A9Q0CET4_9POAL|nr:hypothetical protein LUZ63_009284 [Rhynchospora breviuscula]
MQTAATTLSTQQPLVMNWTGDRTSKYYYLLHFAEIQATSTTNRREFNISARGFLMEKGYIPVQRSGYMGIWDSSVVDYSIALEATSNATLPPLMNAIELYKLVPVGVTTNDSDVAAIHSIMTDQQIKKGWSGDPCLPQEFKWTGIDCTNSTGTLRITGLNLSSSGLTGQLSEYFGKLIALQSLDLSGNDFSGYLPNSLGQLTALSFLDISGNRKLNTTLPSGLQSKWQDGSLIYRHDMNPHPPPPHPAATKNNLTIIIIAVAVPLLVITAAIAAVFWLTRNKHKQSIAPKPCDIYELSPIANDPGRTYANTQQGDDPRDNYAGQAMTTSPQSKAAGKVLPKFEKRQFSYHDIKRITNGFKKSIGTGGYGNVYLGLLENGFQVAVKMRSHTSTQGEKEFLAEAENLTRVHHRNLVSLLGYCIDKNCMALVYEYMQEGNLHDKLKDNASPLAWMQRLRIAYGSALGLEYLHTACNPPLIHRDVKTSNILLNANLEAKIADFGLSKVFNNDAKSPLSTRVVGTLGYLDPEYYTSHQLSEKSDVFSFGVVLLEIITGRPPIITGIEGGNLVEWVHRKLSIGDIKSIVDPRMHDKYDVNSVWKVTELACKCTEYASSRRPTMTVVAAELKESLDLELSTEGMHDENAIELVTDVSQDALSEMAYMVRMINQGPAVR